MTKYFTFLITTIIALLSPLHAQPAEHISFVHIGVNEGLSQNTIFDITQDKQGNMWFATHDGLNKYDGYDFTVYQHDEQNPYSIGSDITRACMSDWVMSKIVPADFPIPRCTLRFYPSHLPLSADKETIYTSEVMKECSSTQSPATRSKMSCRRS